VFRFAILTFGCRVNQADSFELDQALRARGAVEVPADEADLVIVNTCTVTGGADQGARQVIRRLAREHPGVRLLVTGCYATRMPDDLRALPGVVAVITNSNTHDLMRALDEVFPRPVADGGTADNEGCGRIAPGVMGHTAAPLRVQSGCAERCAFCIVPSTRGPSVSRPLDDVVAEVVRLARCGYRELWIVGVHLGAYGRDLTPASSLTGLARALDRVPADVTYRMGSLEPMDCPEALIDLVVSSGRFAPHLHLPLQHTSDRMLAAMRRPYTLAQYRRLVETVRGRIPHAAIGSDFIVGFPGETRHEIDEAALALAGLPLTSLHVFPYSDRPGTDAAILTSKVPPVEVAGRAKGIRAVGRTLSEQFARGCVGTTRPGLTLADGTMVVTDNFLKVRIPPGLPRNQRVRVRIDAAGAAITGTVVDG
jgi:threonylcarbamoyladenosine tRNA methylthiotransferase MtaB